VPARGRVAAAGGRGASSDPLRARRLSMTPSPRARDLGVRPVAPLPSLHSLSLSLSRAVRRTFLIPSLRGGLEPLRRRRGETLGESEPPTRPSGHPVVFRPPRPLGRPSGGGVPRGRGAAAGGETPRSGRTQGGGTGRVCCGQGGRRTADHGRRGTETGRVPGFRPASRWWGGQQGGPLQPC
jgi:hypothetical protein